MKFYSIISLATVICLFGISCRTKQIVEISNRNFTLTKECPFERINAMKVTSTFNTDKVSRLALKLATSAKIDAEAIKKVGDANATLGFADSLAKSFNEVIRDSSEVSQEFYQNMLSQRTALCGLYSMMKDESIQKDADFLRRIQDRFDLIAKQFENLAEQE